MTVAAYLTNWSTPNCSKQKISLLALSLFFSCLAIGQNHRAMMERTAWQKLSDVSYVRTSHPEFGEWKAPVFSSQIREMEGQEIEVEGYIYPFEFKSQPEHIILTALPVNACYFCGTGGPETVMDVYLMKPMEMTNRRIKLKGTLYLNDTDPNQMIYQLENASFEGFVD